MCNTSVDGDSDAGGLVVDVNRSTPRRCHNHADDVTGMDPKREKFCMHTATASNRHNPTSLTGAQLKKANY